MHNNKLYSNECILNVRSVCEKSIKTIRTVIPFYEKIVILFETFLYEFFNMTSPQTFGEKRGICQRRFHPSGLWFATTMLLCMSDCAIFIRNVHFVENDARTQMRSHANSSLWRQLLLPIYSKARGRFFCFSYSTLYLFASLHCTMRSECIFYL